MAAKRDRTGPFVIAYGGEDYLLDRVIDLGRSWEDRAYVLVDGDDIKEAEFVELCEQSSLEGDQVIILDNAHKLKEGKLLAAYVEAKRPTDTETVVVAIYRSEKLSDVWDKASKKGVRYHYPKCKAWEEDKFADRVRAEAKRLGLTLDADVPGLLVRLVGDNLRSVVNELNKLVHLVEPGAKVTKKEVGLVISPDPVAEPFEVAEAATSRDAKTAFRLLSVLYKNMGDGAAVPLTAALMKQVEKLLVARHMLDKGDAPEIIAERLEVHRFVLQKKILPRAQKYTVAELRHQMSQLCRLETQVKGHARSKRTLVELALLSLAS